MTPASSLPTRRFEMNRPRYFPPCAERPGHFPEDLRPVFKVRTGAPADSPGAAAPAAEPTPEPLPEVHPDPALPPVLPSGRDPRVSDTVLAAMDQLDALFTEGPVLQLQAPPVPARPVAPLRPLPEVPPAEVEPGSRGALAPLLLVALLGVGTALAAGVGLHSLKQRQAPRTLVAEPAPRPQPSPALAGTLARAEAGDIVAMRVLALCYRDGLDTPVDALEADRWALRAVLAAPEGPRMALAQAQAAPVEPFR